jgi:small-conductance mechanosensitive channel
MLNKINQINWDSFFDIIVTVLIALIVYWLFCRLIKILEKRLIVKAKNKKEKSDIEIFSRAIRYFFMFCLLIFIVLAHFGSLTGLGIFAGLMSAALGWGLQKPISGIAAWLMIVIKRPFEIGDRIIVGEIKGDISDITLTHIHLKEVGGTIPTEEKSGRTTEEVSGRTVLVPNARLFEEDIINYTKKDNYILDEVCFPVTLESDIEEAKKILGESAQKIIKEYIKQPKIYIRTYFQSSGVNVFVRYFTPTLERNEISSQITEEILKRVRKAKNIRFSYHHEETLVQKTDFGKTKYGV